MVSPDQFALALKIAGLDVMFRLEHAPFMLDLVIGQRVSNYRSLVVALYNFRTMTIIYLDTSEPPLVVAQGYSFRRTKHLGEPLKGLQQQRCLLLDGGYDFLLARHLALLNRLACL